MVCKTIIRRFKSARRLQLLLFVACSDPPDPPPVSASELTLASHVEWREGPSTAERPIVVVIDQRGGPVDRLVAHPDVTTFLNDRFHPVLQPGPDATLAFYTATGCALTGPLSLTEPAEFIAIANSLLLLGADRVTLCEP